MTITLNNIGGNTWQAGNGPDKVTFQAHGPDKALALASKRLQGLESRRQAAADARYAKRYVLAEKQVKSYLRGAVVPCNVEQILRGDTDKRHGQALYDALPKSLREFVCAKLTESLAAFDDPPERILEVTYVTRAQ